MMERAIRNLSAAARTGAAAALAGAFLAGPAATQSIGDLIDLVDPGEPAAPAPAAAPAPGIAAPEAEPVTPDVVTNEVMSVLQRDGLIARQAEINEGLLLMDRQLRQSQLAGQIMQAFGPDRPVEVAPGKFVDFSQTPAGLQQQIAMIDLQIRLAERRADLAAAQAASERAIARETLTSGFMSAAATMPQVTMAPPPAEVQVAEPEAVPVEEVQVAPGQAMPERLEASNLIEISGSDGDYIARIALPGQIAAVRTGDDLPNGQRVMQVDMRSIVLESPSGDRQTLTIRQ